MNPNQKFFNDTLQGYLTKGEKPGWETTSINGLCRYRAPNGSKCAIGRKLDLPETHEAFDFKGSVDSLFEKFPEISVAFSEYESYTLLKIQQAHDDSARDFHEHGFEFKKQFALNMKRVANQFDLSFPKRYEKYLN